MIKNLDPSSSGRNRIESLLCGVIRQQSVQQVEFGTPSVLQKQQRENKKKNRSRNGKRIIWYRLPLPKNWVRNLCLSSVNIGISALPEIGTNRTDTLTNDFGLNLISLCITTNGRAVSLM